jgi:hypothetical protein
MAAFCKVHLDIKTDFFKTNIEYKFFKRFNLNAHELGHGKIY